MNDETLDGALRVSGNIVDLAAMEVFPGTLVLRDGRIAQILREPLAEYSTYLIPGFVDAHVHVESSMLPPAEMARLVLPFGTVAVVADPHEIANVLGVEGVAYMLDSASKSPLHFHFGAPSCVPATPFETAGAELSVASVEQLLDDPRIGFLSEVMNFPGVLAGDPSVLAKIRAAKERGKRVDGHAPGLRGDAARKYAAAGIETDHECADLEEAKEKIAAGMYIALREGSAAKNLDALLPLLKDHPERCFFCTDDAHPDDLARGHIDALARRAIAAGYDVLTVLRVACRNAVQHYGLPVGQLQVFDRADFVEVSDLVSLRVVRTFVRGERVAERGKCLLPFAAAPRVNRFFLETPLLPEAFFVLARGERVRILVATDGSLFTTEVQERPTIRDGRVIADPSRDLLLLTVVNRYQPRAPAVALARGFGLKRGAIASSVAHDSHNIVAVGADEASLCRAVNAIIAEKGGLALVDGEQTWVLPLPIAGLMSDQEGHVVAQQYARLSQYARDALGSKLGAPLMTLSFMALLVIPRLKLGDLGLFCGDTFRFVDLFVDAQPDAGLVSEQQV
jgi:adenine deaminase